MKDKLFALYALGVIFFTWAAMSGSPRYPAVGFFKAFTDAIFWPIMVILNFLL